MAKTIAFASLIRHGRNAYESLEKMAKKAQRHMSLRTARVVRRLLSRPEVYLGVALSRPLF